MDELNEDFQDPGEVMEPCICCGSESGCEHVVFIFDRSFTEFVAGHSDEVHRIAEVVSAIFLGWLNANREVLFRGGSYDHHLRELFGYGLQLRLRRHPRFRLGHGCLLCRKSGRCSW